MIEFGKTMRAAREAKGLSVAQLAEQTHMTPARVEELENENFTSFPGVIFTAFSPRAWYQPSPPTQTRICPPVCACQLLRQPGSNVTLKIGTPVSLSRFESAASQLRPLKYCR